MSAGPFREVDHDLLADYLGGALDGTPQERVVARLVTEEPAWAEAYTLLAPAVAGVRADLAAWGEPGPEMPAAVTDRIVAALARAPETGPVDGAPRADEVTSADAGAGRPATTDPSGTDAVDAAQAARPGGVGPVPAQPLGGRRPAGVTRSEPGRGGTTGPGRRRRRWSRLAGPIALAAVSIAAVGLGVTRLADGQENAATDSAAGSQANPEVAGPAAAGPFRATGAPLRSGTDYTPGDLATAPSPQVRQFASGSPPAGVASEGGRLAGPGNLDRLADPAALNTCLGEISAEHGDGPLVVEVVDYARFQGQPALVVRFTDVTGAHWAWVSGPECGVPGSGSDSRYRTRVG